MNDLRIPRVTVAIPTRNRAELLKGCIQSVLDQTFADIEIIVSDNASTDETADVVASSEDPRIHYSPLEEDIGLYGNLSRCLHLGRAPYLTIVPDDDYMLPRNLERKAEVLDRHPDVGIVHSSFHLLIDNPDGSQVLHEDVNQVGASSDMIESGTVVARRLLSQPYFINFTGALIRRSVVRDDSFEAADGPAADLGLCLRIARKASVAFLAESLVGCRLHSDAGSVRDGIYEFTNGVYRPSLASVAITHLPKERFLARYGAEFDDQGKVRIASRRYRREALRYAIRLRSTPNRTGRDALAVLRAAVRVDRAVLMRPFAFRFLATSLLGVRGRRLLASLKRRVPKFRWRLKPGVNDRRA